MRTAPWVFAVLAVALTAGSARAQRPASQDLIWPPPPEDARVRLFRLRPDRFDELDDWLEHIRAFWTEQLASLKRHVERGDRGA